LSIFKDSIKNNSTFCVLPWVHMSINTRGKFRLCCNQSFIQKDMDKGGYLPIFHADERTVEEVWNSDAYREVRKKMMKGEKIGPCSRCYREEEMGMKSARILNNESWSKSIGYINPDGFCSLDSIRYIDIRLGNGCNLKCRMCNAFSSSAWIDEEKKIHTANIPMKDLTLLENMDWFTKDFFWNSLFSAMKNCELLYFSGGEPMLFREQQLKLFDKCIKSGISKNILLRYNTNLTISIDKFKKYWKHFSHVRINGSLDGVGKVDEYIRYPSKWNIIEKNLSLLYDNIQTKQFPISASIMNTVQIYNIFDLTNVLDFCKQFKLFPILNILNHPQYLNIRVLSTKQKDIVDKMLSEWCQKNEDWVIKNNRHINEYKKLLRLSDYMYKENWEHLYPIFLQKTRELDKLRNQKLEDYIPELMETR